jgi:hypothetical protein
MADMEISKTVQSDKGDVWETRPSGDTQLITITIAYLKMRKKAYKNGSETEENKPKEMDALKRNGNSRRWQKMVEMCLT